MTEFLCLVTIAINLYLVWKIGKFHRMYKSHALHSVRFREMVKYNLWLIGKALDRIEALVYPADQKAVAFEFYEKIGEEWKRVNAMQVQSIEETKKYKVVPVDKAGNEAKMDGAPQISLTDGSLADVVFNEDGTFDVVPKGPIGAAKLQVVGDALIGEGTEEIFGEEDFQFVAGKAVAIKVVPV